MFENPRRSRQARNFTTNVLKILDLKSSSEQIFFRKLLLGAPDIPISSQNWEIPYVVVLSVGVCKQKTAAVFDCFLTISDSFSCTRKAIGYSVKSSNPKPEN